MAQPWMFMMMMIFNVGSIRWFVSYPGHFTTGKGGNVQQTVRSRVLFPILALKCFIDINLLAALRSLIRRPLTEINTRNISLWVKAANASG
jgi:hypothetical protein